MTQSELEDEEYNNRINDLSDKFRRDVVEGGYIIEEYLPALMNCLIDIFLEADDSDGLFRVFIRQLSERYDDICIETDQLDDKEEN